MSVVNDFNVNEMVSCVYKHYVGLLGIVPLRGCEAILIEILQPKWSTSGPHFRRCFLINEDPYYSTRYTIGILTLILLCHEGYVWNHDLLHVFIFSFLQRFITRWEGIFTNLQYSYSCSISIKMASQSCSGTIPHYPTHCVFTAMKWYNVWYEFCWYILLDTRDVHVWVVILLFWVILSVVHLNFAGKVLDWSIYYKSNFSRLVSILSSIFVNLNDCW